MISEAKILEIIDLWNKVILDQILVDRTIVNDIVRFHDKGKNKEIIDLVGVRRAGKSSILALIMQRLNIKVEEMLYVNFEEPLFVNDYSIDLIEKIWNVYRTKINPDKKPFLFFDEIQLIPMWEKWVRRIRDLQLAHVFVTGSSSDLLSKEYGTALTGRHISFKIYPLNFREFLYFKDQKINKNSIGMYDNKLKIINLFSKYLNIGGFPEIVLKDNLQILKNYFDDILYKDIIGRHKIRDVNSLKKLAVFCLTNIGNRITYNSLRKNFSLSLDTVREYLSYFAESFFIFQIPIYSYSLKVQEISPKKIYCIDNGLRNAVSFKFSKDEGRLAENLVFIELKRKGEEIYYWRNKEEIDFVVRNRDQSLSAINVSYADEIDERELKALLDFKNKFKKKVKELLLITKDLEKTEYGIRFIPLWKYLLE